MSETHDINYSPRDIFVNGLIVIAIVTVLNAIVFQIFSALGAYEGVINPNRGVELFLLEIVQGTVITCFIGLLVFIPFTKYVGNPIPKWRTTGYIVVILICLLPFTLEGDDRLLAIISLEIIHVIAGIGMIFGIPYLLDRKS